jgi:hypothetical protein
MHSQREQNTNVNKWGRNKTSGITCFNCNWQKVWQHFCLWNDCDTHVLFGNLQICCLTSRVLPHLFTLVFCSRCECMKYCHSWTLNNQQSINYWSEINSEPEHWLSLSTWLNHICHCWLHWLSLSTWLNHICHCWLHWLSLSTWLNHICHCWLKQMKYPRYYNCSTEGNPKSPKLTCQHSQGVQWNVPKSNLLVFGVDRYSVYTN